MENLSGSQRTMIKFQFAELVNEDGTVRRLRYPVAAKYRDCLKKNVSKLARDVSAFSEEPSHLNYYSTQLNRHLRHEETPSSYLSRAVTDPRVRITPFLRWKLPELRSGNHFSVCLCMKRNGMQMLCPRWGCRGSLQCGSGILPSARGPGCLPEPSCCESWSQRASEADRQLDLMKKAVVVARGLY